MPRVVDTPSDAHSGGPLRGSQMSIRPSGGLPSGLLARAIQALLSVEPYLSATERVNWARLCGKLFRPMLDEIGIDNARPVRDHRGVS
ncbi:MAG: hypothetical protein LUQ21_02275 [Methanothrix sp.]|nr:hypothetical protein [Methanothrix sp.]